MTAAHDHLRSVVDRVLNLKAQQDEISGDIKEVYAEAKALGLDKTAVGQLVAHLRKQKKDPKKFETNSALFETYLEAYEHGTPLATRAHAHEATPARPTAADRAARSKRRLSESMDDSKALSAEMLAAGLISEASHAENIRIADGVAMKLGAGVLNPEPDPDPTPPHDPTTGELIDDVPGNGPATAPAPGAGGLTSAKGDAGETTGEAAPHMLAASSINSEIHREPSNRDVSADGKAYSAAASQGQAAHAGIGSETLASHEGDTQGEGASALSPINTAARPLGSSASPVATEGLVSCRDQNSPGYAAVNADQLGCEGNRLSRRPDRDEGPWTAVGVTAGRDRQPIRVEQHGEQVAPEECDSIPGEGTGAAAASARSATRPDRESEKRAGMREVRGDASSLPAVSPQGSDHQAVCSEPGRGFEDEAGGDCSGNREVPAALRELSRETSLGRETEGCIAGETAPLSNSAAGAVEQGLGTAPKSMPGPDLSSSVAAIPFPATEAPVEANGPPEPPGAPILSPVDEWADLDIPARFDRREKAA